MKNERTSDRVASIAGKMLRKVKEAEAHKVKWIYVMVSDVRAIAASALTQAKDRPKKNAKVSRDV